MTNHSNKNWFPEISKLSKTRPPNKREDILKALQDKEHGMTSRQIAEAIGAPLPNVQKLISLSMKNHGMMFFRVVGYMDATRQSRQRSALYACGTGYDLDRPINNIPEPGVNVMRNAFGAIIR